MSDLHRPSAEATTSKRSAGTRNASTSVSKTIVELPLDILKRIVEYLDPSEKSLVSGLHSSLACAVRASWRSCKVDITDPKINALFLANTLCQCPNISTISLSIKSLQFSLLNILRSRHIRELHLEILQGPFRNAAKKIQDVCVSFPSLTSLTLKPESEINEGGCLRHLSTLTNLQSLEVHNVVTDKGLDALQGLRNLKLVLPSHEACPLEDIMCGCCGELVAARLADFMRDKVDWSNFLRVGDRIRFLPHLEFLTIQFSASHAAESHLDMSPCLNFFYWNNDSSNEGIHHPVPVDANLTDSDPGQIECFPSLITINLVNVCAPWSLLRDGIWPRNCGANLWDVHKIRDAFACMPSLQHWRMLPAKPGPLDEEPIAKVGDRIEWSCACDHLIEMTVIQEGEEVLYDVIRPQL